MVSVVTGFVGEGPGAPGGDRPAGGSCQAPRCRRIFSTTRGSSITAITRIGFWQTGQRKGSTCQTRKIRSRHRLEGSLRGGGGERLGGVNCNLRSDPDARSWRTRLEQSQPRRRVSMRCHGLRSRKKSDTASVTTVTEKVPPDTPTLLVTVVQVVAGRLVANSRT